MTQKRSKPNDSDLCQFRFSDGRKCKMLRDESHPALCPIHACQELQLLEAGRIGAELASLSGEFKTTTDVNHVLGRLFSLLANGRIPRRNALALAYIGQLLLQSVPGTRSEYRDAHAPNFQVWDLLLRQVYAHPPARAASPSSPSPAPHDPVPDTVFLRKAGIR
jgi:hypothetical protein